jgi:hypothetical protein
MGHGPTPSSAWSAAYPNVIHMGMEVVYDGTAREHALMLSLDSEGL